MDRSRLSFVTFCHGNLAKVILKSQAEQGEAVELFRICERGMILRVSGAI